MKLEQGDIFEVENATWLREKLPHYESVWSTFIGHNGTGWPCEMPGLEEAADNDRRQFYQAHYSMAWSMRKLMMLTEAFQKDSGQVRNYREFESVVDRLFSYMAYVGHVRDMFTKIDAALGLKGTLTGVLQDFYAQRNHVLHGPRLPVQFKDGFLMISSLATQNEVFGEWTSKTTWKSVDPEGFKFVADFVASTTDALFKLVNELHGKIYSAATSRFGRTSIIERQEDGMPCPISGTLFAPAISAFVPPSGEFLK